MTSVAPYLLALALAQPLASAGSTEAAREDPVLAALVAEALERNPELLAAEESLRAARERIAQASALPDPLLSVSYTNDGWSPTLGEEPMTTLGVMASQALPYPGKRSLRGRIASSEARQAAEGVARARLRLVADVKRAYYGLLLARELLAITREQRELWRQIESVVRARYAVGQGAQQDVLRVQVEMTRVEQSEIEQQAEAEIRLVELAQLVNRPSDAPLETPARLTASPLEIGTDAAVEQARRTSPELASAGLAAERGGLALALAQRDARPDFSLQAGYMNRGGLDPMWQAGLGITLPVRRGRRAAAVAEAKALVRASERSAESVELRLRFRTQERLTRLKSTEKVLALYQQGIIPQDRLSVEAAIANYQAGRLPFIAVLEALQTLFGDRATLSRLTADHQRLVASLEEASLEPGAEATAVVGSSVLSLSPAESGAMAGGMSGR